MGMFTNYQSELLRTYKPNNISTCFPTPISDSRLNSVSSSKPYEEYNFKGELIGYSWYQGETLNLDFSIEGEVTVEPDSIISMQHGETPEGLECSIAGKKYYNLVDMKSWKSYLDNSNTVWVEDSEFTYPESGIDLRSIYMPAEKYLSDKSVIVILYNFRMEPIHTWTPQINGSRVVCSIDKELSSKLPKGTYYCNVIVENDAARLTVFNSTDCIFLVK